MGWMVALWEGRPAWARMFEHTDPAAWVAVLRALGATQTKIPGLRLNLLATPLISVWAEDNDEARVGLPGHAQVVVIPGADHVGVVEHHEIVWPLIRSLAGSTPAAQRA